MAAGGDQQQAHRPGSYKQKNKGHKHGKHRTKGEIGRENKGKVAVMAITKKQKRELRKMDRRNKANQLRRNKKDSVLTEKRKLGSRDGPPHLVAVIALHSGVDAGAVTKILKAEVDGVVHEDQGVSGAVDSFGLVLPRFKQRFTFYRPDMTDLHSVLDVAKIADSLVFVLDSTEGWDSYGEYCLSCLFSQGLPSHALVCQGIADLAVKKRTESRRALSRLVESRFQEARIFPIDTEQDALLLVRHLSAQKQRRLAFRSRRSHLLVQSATYISNTSQNGATGLGTLCVSGYVRGAPLKVNRLVHIAGHGDFQLSQIDAPSDPLPLTAAPRQAKPGRGGEVEMMDGADGDINGDRSVRVLMKADPEERESLQAEAEVDPMDGEQTWPTEAELEEAEEASKKKNVMKVPKGTSDYQAMWIIDGAEKNEEDDDDEEDVDSCDDDEDGMMEDEMDADNESQDAGSECASGDDDDDDEEEEEEEEEEINSTGRTGADQKYDECMDEAEEGEGLRRYREARANEMFPDEVDTPLDVPAKTRFQRYRGLKSFRSSPWDPLENLPPNYSRIYQFQNFERMRRRMLAEAASDEEGAMVGWYVNLHIVDVPPSVMESFQAGKPLVLVSLLPHEQKMSVMHMLVRQHPSNTEPIKSKEELVFQCGFRRFRASAIFSQHTSSDKHKLERFLRPDAPTVMSVYAPITFPTAGVLVFKQRDNGMQDLVATGSLLSCDPRRVVLKRIVLSGHPFKINRRSAVVRYMFFNRDDILWFKPVELRTKWGRRGHIKEALGTHGHMKCVFDNQLRSQDTVLMNLYKRVYPHWTYDPYVPAPLPWVKRDQPVFHDIDME